MTQISAVLDSLPSSIGSFATNVVNGDWGVPVAVPVWAVLAAIALIVVLLLGRLLRPSYEGGGGMWRFAVIVLLAIVAWRGFQFLEESKVQAARAALAERVARAITAPLEGNPLLACANGIANAELRAACERTVFAKPENAAAAVALVKDRLDLLALASDPTSGLGPEDPRTQRLRRALEIDDFGLVAYVLVESERCQPDACAPLALFNDAAKIKANMAARVFEGLVEKQSVIWNPGRSGPFGFKQVRPETPPVTAGTVEPPPAVEPPPPSTPPSPPPNRPEPQRAEPPPPAPPPPPPPRPVARPPSPAQKPPVTPAPVQPMTPRLAPPTPLVPPLAPASPPPSPDETAEPAN